MVEPSIPIIALAEAVKTYRMGDQDVRALDGINLELAAGEFVAITGPSGAGKSTLLHVLGVLDTVDSGSVALFGQQVATLNDNQQAEFRRRRIGFVFQFFNLLPTMSAWENVALPRLLDGQAMSNAKTDALLLLDRVGLGHRANHRPSELSGGQMQRVAVARALMMDPALILADEPTGNLDSASGKEILTLLAELAHDTERDRLVVMVTHDDEAAHTTDRILRMRDGRLSRVDVPTGDGAQ
jgi:putative ABC transport system ATP-binding protein